MIIKEAIYTHTFHNVATGEWDKVGLIGELEEGDDYRQCLYQLKKNVHSFHYESKGADEKKATEEKVVQESKPKKTKEENLIEAINSCTSKIVLESYALIVKSHANADVKTAYEEKLKTFQ